jgi:nicotinamide-nucleotide amidase
LLKELGGGLIAERITNVPGSSRYFISGVICYSNEWKMELTGIPPLLLEMQGAVSAEVARGLAEGIRARMGTTIGVGVTGIAGPGGGSEEKPVGTVHIAVATPAGTEHRQFLYPGDRERVRWQASQAALDMVRRELMKM